MKFPIWASVLSLIGFLVLLSLGSWQVKRLHWKLDLIEQIETAYAANPMGFELTGQSVSQIDERTLLIRGFAEGIFYHEHEMLFSPRTFEGKQGYHLITPFETLDNHTLLVNRGWVDLNYDSEKISRPQGPVIIKGTLRRAERNHFAPANNPEKEQWHRLDIDEIAKEKELKAVLSFVLYEDNETDYPKMIAKSWKPNNNHLSYALFWYVMAGVLLIIYYLRFIHPIRKKTT